MILVNKTTDAKKILKHLIQFEVFLIFMYALNIFFNKKLKIIHFLFDLDGEWNIPAIFSASQLFAIGLIFYHTSRIPNETYRILSRFFVMIALGFIFLSLDELLSIHERINWKLLVVNYMPHFKAGHGAWIFLYALIAFALLAVNFRPIILLHSLYFRESLTIALGFSLLLFGAVFLEILSYQFLRDNGFQLLYSVEVALEEFFEMCGASIILYGSLMFYIKK